MYYGFVVAIIIRDSHLLKYNLPQGFLFVRFFAHQYLNDWIVDGEDMSQCPSFAPVIEHPQYLRVIFFVAIGIEILSLHKKERETGHRLR